MLVNRAFLIYRVQKYSMIDDTKQLIKDIQKVEEFLQILEAIKLLHNLSLLEQTTGKLQVLSEVLPPKDLKLVEIDVDIAEGPKYKRKYQNVSSGFCQSSKVQQKFL